MSLISILQALAHEVHLGGNDLLELIRIKKRFITSPRNECAVLLHYSQNQRTFTSYWVHCEQAWIVTSHNKLTISSALDIVQLKNAKHRIAWFAFSWLLMESYCPLIGCKQSWMIHLDLVDKFIAAINSSFQILKWKIEWKLKIFLSPLPK